MLSRVRRTLRLRRIAVAVTAGAVGSVLVIGAAPAAVADTYSSPATGTHSVIGAILQEYRAVGGPQGRLGYPVTDELPTPRGGGRFNHFQHGSIYWAPGLGAHEMYGAIRGHWASLGWETSVLGFPVTDEFLVGRGGIAQNFTGGSIYWSPQTGAHSVIGAIRQRWGALGWEQGYLGLPVTDEIRLPRGAYQLFQGGAVYWSPASGAHAVRGAIAAKWAETGWENGPLGFPVSDENALPGGASSHFQGGTISWSPDTGAKVVVGAIRHLWAEMGWEGSLLGRPVTDEYSVPGGRQSDFEYGSILWTPLLGAAPDVTVTGSGPGQFPVRVGAARMVVAVESTYTTGYFGVSAYGDGVSLGSLAGASGTYSGTASLNTGQVPVAVTDVHVSSDGLTNWSLNFMPLAWSPLLHSGDTRYDAGREVFHYVGSPTLLRITASNSFSLSVGAYDNRGERIWLKAVSRTPTSGVWYLPPDVYLEVEAAMWELAVD